MGLCPSTIFETQLAMDKIGYCILKFRTLVVTLLKISFKFLDSNGLNNPNLHYIYIYNIVYVYDFCFIENILLPCKFVIARLQLKNSII